MRIKRRMLVLGAALALTAGLELFPRPALAQDPYHTPNTYAAFPYNQGSLFYRPMPPTSTRRATTTPAATTVVPQRRGLFGRRVQPAYVTPAQGGGYYYNGYYYPPQYRAPAR